ncbi:MAG: F0F1 ATP synthase subunit A [Acidimicrobiia bacterium]|nr:F0F1 ATP synthase subunit A [Acidimicrobiia bacterium]MBV9040561.1 F0F1 ATP synthase subunit A [Acidimicrobiia bacterium]
MWAVNKVVLLEWLAVVLLIWFFLAARKGALVPSGVQNVAEAAVDFVRNEVILQTIGPEGLNWTPFLLTLFTFIFVCNIFEVIPVIQMPVNARMALPFFMTAIVFFIYHYLGFRHQGFLGYFKSMLFPPGVPKALYLLVSPIEFLTYFFTRPLSLAVRLFANMLAGHLLLATFAILTAALFTATYIGAVIPGALLVALYGFEVLVSVLQAFIFTILTAVYIGGAIHPEH